MSNKMLLGDSCLNLRLSPNEKRVLKILFFLIK